MEVPNGLGNVPDLIKRFKHAVERWELFRSLHQDAFDYAAPNRETFTTHSPGQRKNRQVFDSTAVLGVQKFANRIQSAMFPAWQEWMEFTPGTDIPEDQKDKVKDALEDMKKEFFASLNSSNFYTEITPSLVDLAVGTGAIQVEEGSFVDNEALRFTNVPLAELYPEMPPGGAIQSVWRKQEVEPKLIKQIWPDAVLTDKLQKMAGKPAAKAITILNGQIFSPKDKKYHQVIIYEADKALLFTQSFDTKRLIVFRWHVTPKEVFGRGPVIQMLPDILTANKIKQFILENAAIQMAGVYTGVDDGIFNPHTVRIAPGAVIPVGSNSSQNPSLVPLNRSGDLGLGGIVLEDLQSNINKALFADPLGDVTDPVKSATEIMVRQQEMLKSEGASFGRIKSELIEALVRASVDILGGLGRIAKVKVDGREVGIRLQSPLAKSESLDDFQNTQVWFSFLQQTMPPEAIAGSVRIEELPGKTAEQLGVDSDLIRPEDERKEVLAKQAEQAQQQNIQGGAGGQQ